MREISLHENAKVVISDRFGGVSKGAYKSLNLGTHVGDEPLRVAENREIFASFFGTKSENLCFMEQIHGNEVKIIDKNSTPKADAIITRTKDLVLCVMVADCVPIVLFDSQSGTVAAIHAGRKGVFANIVTNTIEAMRQNCQTDAKDINAYVGASIGVCCYEINGVVLKEAKERFAFATVEKGEKRFLDLRKIVKKQLSQKGVKNIIDDNICTCCDKSYFSYRRDGVCGRFALGVKIK